MNKRIIAIDIDDVLADNANGMVAFSNQRWGTNLTIEDYQEHWSDMWQIDHEETEKRSDEFHNSGIIGKLPHSEEALPTLEGLRDDYKLIVVTSRRRSVESETRDWLARHYAGVFDDIYFAGIYDKRITSATFTQTKGDIYRAINADYVVDDQLKHCLAAVKSGKQAILFGDYPWNQIDDMPKGIIRCRDWPAVREYLDGQRS